ncbi:transmembrane protein, putative [Bodo saltans]|uniref:Transmembrane protein, putative n=1 Tax=Bodo saltans TaxID=75058 RepID=A0A0S4IK10_BODSA|nr:transmembrane protein, putative [Bodo saltans]|eukprot:CUE61681.1 transmembrane protein, putative [Bodo saltans]
MVSTVSQSTMNVTDIAVDKGNNLLYVAYNSVFKLSSNGSSAQLIAGSVVSGNADGVGGAARFNDLYGITCDTANNIAYISDSSNHRTRTLNLTNNNVTTLAGNSSGYRDGIGVNAQFSGPYGIAHYTSRIDGVVLLFVADTGNVFRVRRIVVATANVTTVAQTSYRCWFLCISRNGSSLFVGSDYTVVRISTSTSTIVTLAGGASTGSTDGIGTSAGFNGAFGIALNDNETAVFVADSNNSLVRRLELSSNNVSTIAGNTTSGLVDGPGLAAKFSYPFGGKWFCNKTSLLCGLLVADKSNAAIRFVAIEQLGTRTAEPSNEATLTSTASISQTSTMPLSRSLSTSQSATSTFAKSVNMSTSGTNSKTTSSSDSQSRTMVLSKSLSTRQSVTGAPSTSYTRTLSLFNSHSDSMEPSALVSESHSPLESQSLSLISSSSSKNFSRTSSESFALANEMKPQRPSDAVVGAVSATAAVGALGGDPSSSISLVMLALLTCSHDPPVSVATYFVSLFFGLGNVAMALGNIGLAMGVILLHFFGALILAKVSPSALVRAVDGPAPRGAFDRFLPVASMCYFPSQSVKVLIMLLPGSVLGGVAGTIRGASGGDVAACAVAILLDVALFSALVLVQQRVVLPRSEYVRYPQQYSVGYTVEKTVLFPSARWEPTHAPIFSTTVDCGSWGILAADLCRLVSCMFHWHRQWVVCWRGL